MGHHGPQPRLTELTNRLRQDDHRITGPRQLILDALRQEAHPLSARELHERLHASCDLATVYRSLKLLETKQMVKRFNFGDHTTRFELVVDHDDDHHHHLICRECRTMVKIKDCFPHTFEERIASLHGFHDVTHQLEFFGLCPNCHSA